MECLRWLESTSNCGKCITALHAKPFRCPRMAELLNLNGIGILKENQTGTLPIVTGNSADYRILLMAVECSSPLSKPLKSGAHALFSPHGDEASHNLFNLQPVTRFLGRSPRSVPSALLSKRRVDCSHGAPAPLSLATTAALCFCGSSRSWMCLPALSSNPQ